MPQNATHSTTIPLNQLPAALAKAVELAKQNHITDKHLWVGFEIFEADQARAAQLATTIAHEIGGPTAQGVVVDVAAAGGGAKTQGAAAGTQAAASTQGALPHPKIIGLIFNPKV